MLSDTAIRRTALSFERQLNDRFRADDNQGRNGRNGEGFRALQRTKASHAGTRVGSGTELWGFVLWPGREAAVRSGKTTEAAARHTTPTIIIEVRNVDLSSFSGRVAMR